MSKHKKIRNTLLIFEQLNYQLTQEAMEGKTPTALNVIKRNFNKNTELFKELRLYEQFFKLTFKSKDEANELINLTLTKRKSLDEKKLNSEKFKLIKEINSAYGVKLFNHRQKNYKLFANIYKLFEDAVSNNGEPTELITAKNHITEHLTFDKPKIQESVVDAEYAELDPQMKLLTFKTYLNNFNEQYKDLIPEQKEVLTRYINSISHTEDLKLFIDKHVGIIKPRLQENVNKIKSATTKVKVEYLIENINNQFKGKYSTDGMIEKVLNYYNLINELNRI